VFPFSFFCKSGPERMGVFSLVQGRMHMNKLPETGFLRLPQIIGDSKADPPVAPLIPVKKSSWWEGVRTGRYPKPVKLGRCTMWRVEDIRALIEKAK